MIRSRVDFHQQLKAFAAKYGLAKVYYTPTMNVRMVYPCIVYEDTGVSAKNADNIAYLQHSEYELKIITTDGDSNLPFKLMDEFPYIANYSGRRFISDNLHHYVVNCRIATKR